MDQKHNWQKTAAWLVHVYTGLGLPLALGAYIALRQQRDAAFFLFLALAVIIDSTDGYFARKLRVWEVVPEFDGRKLDDLIDYLNYVFLPVLALLEWELLPAGWEWIAALPLIASGYGFSQQIAKTEDSFVGFPSYWNVMVFYLYIFNWGAWVDAGVVVILSVLVFVPVHYVYPSKTARLQRLTIGLASLWGILLVAALFNFNAPWVPGAMQWSLLFPAYYTVLSLVHHRSQPVRVPGK